MLRKQYKSGNTLEIKNCQRCLAEEDWTVNSDVICRLNNVVDLFAINYESVKNADSFLEMLFLKIVATLNAQFDEGAYYPSGDKYFTDRYYAYSKAFPREYRKQGNG